MLQLLIETKREALKKRQYRQKEEDEDNRRTYIDIKEKKGEQLLSERK